VIAMASRLLLPVIVIEQRTEWAPCHPELRPAPQRRRPAPASDRRALRDGAGRLWVGAVVGLRGGRPCGDRGVDHTGGLVAGPLKRLGHHLRGPRSQRRRNRRRRVNRRRRPRHRRRLLPRQRQPRLRRGLLRPGPRHEGRPGELRGGCHHCPAHHRRARRAALGPGRPDGDQGDDRWGRGGASPCRLGFGADPRGAVASRRAGSGDRGLRGHPGASRLGDARRGGLDR
jgi:hypothetical protein